MNNIETTAYDVALRFVGIKEVPGQKDHPFIQWCLSLCGFPLDVHDEVPNCSAFINAIGYILGLQRTKSAMARSWLTVGTSVSLGDAEIGNDLVILKRGTEPQPDKQVLNAPGHIGLFAGYDANRDRVLVLAANQSDAINIASFPASKILDIRRWY